MYLWFALKKLISFKLMKIEEEDGAIWFKFIEVRVFENADPQI